MKNTEIYPASVIDAIRESLEGDSGTPESIDAVINEMSKKEIFNAYCEWEGILGEYPRRLWDIFEAGPKILSVNEVVEALNTLYQMADKDEPITSGYIMGVATEMGILDEFMEA